MKKLINLLETNVTVSSLGLSNTKIDSDSSADLISSALLTDINTAAVNAGVNVTITTAISGHDVVTSSGNPSRHIAGLGVDIAIIDGVYHNGNAAKFKELGDKLCNALKNMGYTTNGEVTYTQTPKVVLWQVTGHYDHLHISNTTGVSSTGTTSKTTSGTSTAAVPGKDDDLQKIVDFNIGKVFSKAGEYLNAATGMTVKESKSKKISEQIDRIKQLLK
jgi:hypothetical protein